MAPRAFTEPYIVRNYIFTGVFIIYLSFVYSQYHQTAFAPLRRCSPPIYWRTIRFCKWRYITVLLRKVVIAFAIFFWQQGASGFTLSQGLCSIKGTPFFQSSGLLFLFGISATEYLFISSAKIRITLSNVESVWTCGKPLFWNSITDIIPFKGSHPGTFPSISSFVSWRPCWRNICNTMAGLSAGETPQGNAFRI